MLCYVARVACCVCNFVCKSPPRPSMKKNKNLKKISLQIFECQHTVTLRTGKGHAVRVGEEYCDENRLTLTNM